MDARASSEKTLQDLRELLDVIEWVGGPLLRPLGASEVAGLARRVGALKQASVNLLEFAERQLPRGSALVVGLQAQRDNNQSGDARGIATEDLLAGIRLPWHGIRKRLELSGIASMQRAREGEGEETRVPPVLALSTNAAMSARMAGDFLLIGRNLEAFRGSLDALLDAHQAQRNLEAHAQQKAKLPSPWDAPLGGARKPAPGRE